MTERGEGGSEWRKEGATKRGRGEREERGRKGDSEGGLQGRYPEEDTGQYPAVIARNNTQRGPCHSDFGITGIVMRRNVLFDWLMT